MLKLPLITWSSSGGYLFQNFIPPKRHKTPNIYVPLRTMPYFISNNTTTKVMMQFVFINAHLLYCNAISITWKLQARIGWIKATNGTEGVSFFKCNIHFRSRALSHKRVVWGSQIHVMMTLSWWYWSFILRQWQIPPQLPVLMLQQATKWPPNHDSRLSPC